MIHLALRNLRLRKLRTGLSILAVGVGIMTLVVLRGMAEGTIGEVADRMKSIKADLLVYNQSPSTVMLQGSTMSAKYADVIRREIPGASRVVPVLTDSIELAGQRQTVYAVPVEDFDLFIGPEDLVAGNPLSAQGHEVIVDEVLARHHPGGLAVGDTVTYRDTELTVAGIAREGVVGRVFMSYNTVTEALYSGESKKANLLVVKVDDPAQASRVARQIRDDLHMFVIDKEQYYGVILKDWGIAVTFVESTAVLTLLVSLLTILLTMFTIVQEQTREVGILRSMGATRTWIMGLVVSQSLIICTAGIAVGLAMSVGAKYALYQARPLLTVDVSPELVATAIAVGLAGGLLGAIYPGWRAASLDPVDSLSYE